MILGASGFAIFIFYVIYLERRSGLGPLIPPTIFRQPTLVVNYAETVIYGICLWCLLCYLPLYYEAVKGFSLVIISVADLPEIFNIALASHHRHYRSYHRPLSMGNLI